jgi:hypothetical protein
MNRIPHPVNLVSKFIIIIITNFTGKSGAENHWAAKHEMETRKMQIFCGAPTRMPAASRAAAAGGEIILTIDAICSSYQYNYYER